jgi:hypothetical protein
MEVMPIPPEILDQASAAMTLEVPIAPQATAGIPEYRCKVYRARLNLEMDRRAGALPRNKFSLFPGSTRRAGAVEPTELL